MQAQKAMFRNSACQVVPELAIDKSRNRPGALPLPAQKCFQLLGNDLISTVVSGLRGRYASSIATKVSLMQAGTQFPA